MLSGATVLLVIMLLIEEMKGKISGLPKISAKEMVTMLNHEDAIALDLRDQEKFDKGHILGSINIPHSDIEKQLKKLGTNKNKTIILVDNNDAKLSAVEAKIRASGFVKIYALTGGIASWRDAQLPLNKK